MKLDVQLGGVTRTIDVIDAPGGGWQVVVDGGAPRRITGRRWRGTTWRLAEGEAAPRRLDVALDGRRVFVRDAAHGFGGEVVDARDRALALGSGGSAGAVHTPMPGAVVRVPVVVGQVVRKGDVVVVVEAMKMENELRAPVDGEVTEVAVAACQAVEAGALLVVVTA